MYHKHISKSAALWLRLSPIHRTPIRGTATPDPMQNLSRISKARKNPAAPIHAHILAITKREELQNLRETRPPLVSAKSEGAILLQEAVEEGVENANQQAR